jgi:ABC-type uncharacterized transport system permease subunit
MILTTSVFLWVSSLAAALAYAWLGLSSARASLAQPRALLLGAWGLHALALFAGFFHSEWRFGFAPALSMTAWITLSIYVIESRFFPNLRTHGVWACVGAAAVLLAAQWPGGAHLNGGGSLLAAHSVLGLSAYGLFVAAAIHAWLLTRSEKRLRSPQDMGAAVQSLPVLTIERLMFQFVVAGFVFLTATLVAGMFFSGSMHAWWRDHKITFSLLAWLVIAVLLIGRLWLGWRGKKAARFIYTGTVLLLLGYAGTRFVLEVVLGR